MPGKAEHRKTSRYRDIAAELQKAIRLGSYPVEDLLPAETGWMARFAARRIGLGRDRRRAAGAVHPPR